MKHLDDGTIQAFLDDELRPGERADAAEHLLGCRRCRTAKDELARAHSVFSEAVSFLDVEPAGSAPAATGRRLSLGGAAFVKAASLVLLVSAAASAAVPGSPVREWIERTVGPESAVEEAPTLEVETAAPGPARPPAPAGVSLPARGAVDVVLSGLRGSTIRLVETDGQNIAVSTLGAETDPAFRTSAGRIEVRDGVGGEVTVEMPRSLRVGRLVVDGELYAECESGALRVHVPAETVGGAHIWR
ncbi:MAG: zf-HC2 domain-containing protein [Longimicrobiales bacterium]